MNKIKKYISNFNYKRYKTAALFTSGNFLVAIIGGISGLLYGKWIDPGTLGEFNKYGILTGYLAFGIIFVDAAFQRHFPYYLGKGNKEKALEIASYAKWFYQALFYLGLLIFSVLALNALFNHNYRGFAGWSAQILAYGITTLGLYLNILYRSNDDFLKLNRNMLITAGMGVLTLPLIYFFHFSGLAVRKILQDFTNLYTLYKRAPYRVKAKFNLKEIKNLAKVSLPLQLPVYLDSHLLKATISLFILKYLGEEQLGLFAMALMLQGFLLVFSKSLNQIIVTKLMLKFGSNDSLNETFKYIIKPVVALSLSSLILVLIFNYLIGYAVPIFLPMYVGSIVILQILAFELVLALARVPFTLFISSLMYKEMIVIRVTKVLITFLALLFFHENLTQIALVIISANLLNLIAGYILLLYKLKTKPILRIKE